MASTAFCFYDNYFCYHSCWIDATPSKPAMWTFLVPIMIVISVSFFISVILEY